MSRDEFHRYLDGEVELDDVPENRRPHLSSQAASWDRLVSAYRIHYPAAPAPAWLEDRVMAEIDALGEPSLLRRLWGWLLRPQPIHLSPAVAGLAVAAVAIVLLLSRSTPSVGPAAAGGDGAAVVYVQFDLTAPGAHSVSVGGDFDAWRGSHALEDPDGDGTWSGRVAVRPGVHTYMFLVDGDRWVTDPEANHYTDDGFGNRNAVLAVAAPAT
ncbi:MAG: glycogen-binding domain-containing protein [Gemmatimonadota bacterium]|jgi:hypothetical protein